jgi:hypothetical protein
MHKLSGYFALVKKQMVWLHGAHIFRWQQSLVELYLEMPLLDFCGCLPQTPAPL